MPANGPSLQAPPVCADTGSVTQGRLHPVVVALALASFLAAGAGVGCGASREPGGDAGDYPVVTDPRDVRSDPPEELKSGETCERQPQFDGRMVVVPPPPGLEAHAITDRQVRVVWSFQTTPPADCRLKEMLISLDETENLNAVPVSERIDIEGTKGTLELTYPDFLPPPNIVLASAWSKQGHRSRTVAVKIRR